MFVLRAKIQFPKTAGIVTSTSLNAAQFIISPCNTVLLYKYYIMISKNEK